MNSRWDDAAAQGLSDLDLLVYASRLIGAETSLVVWGGGNTSVKRTERDHRGREVRVLRVKGSGSDLKSIQKKDFPGVVIDDIRALLERPDMDDQVMVDYFAHALLEPASPRPSIETPLHGFLAPEAIIHTHADAIVSLTNNDRCAEVLREVYGGDIVSLAYLRPGFPIAKQVAQTFEAHPEARAILLEKHGTICWGATVKEAYLSTIELISRAEEAIAHRAVGRARFGGVAVTAPAPEARRRVALAVAPRLRGPARPRPARDPDLRRQRRRARVRGLGWTRASSATSGPPRPITRSTPSGCRASPRATGRTIPTRCRRRSRRRSTRSSRTTRRTSTRHNRYGATLTDPFPRVVAVAGLGMFTAGKDRRTSGIVSDIYHHTISVVGAASTLRALRLALRPGRLRLRVLAARAVQAHAGAAGARAGPAHRAGHGRGERDRPRRRPAAGRRGRPRGRDRPGRGGRAQGRRRGHGGLGGRARRRRRAWTWRSEDSVRAAFEDAVLAYGGIDIVVSNAGHRALDAHRPPRAAPTGSARSR